MPDYRPLMSALADEYEQWTDIPVSKLIRPALAWWEASDRHEALTEARDATYSKLWHIIMPRALYDVAALREGEHSGLQDSGADLAIEMALAITEYAMADLLDVFDARKDALAERDGPDPDELLERARDERDRVAGWAA